MNKSIKRLVEQVAFSDILDDNETGFYDILKARKQQHMIYHPRNKRELRRCMDTLINNKDYDFNKIDVSLITDFSYLFYTWTRVVNKLDIRFWDVYNGINFSHMFEDCKRFNTDLSYWNVSNGRIFSHMFSGCTDFNQDISGWIVDNGSVFNGMFFGCQNFNQDISGWNMKNAQDTTDMLYNTFSLQYKDKIKKTWLEKYNIKI